MNLEHLASTSLASTSLDINGKSDVLCNYMFWTSPCVCGELFVGVCCGMKMDEFCWWQVLQFGCLLIFSKTLAQHGWTCFWFLDLSGTIIYLYLFVAFVQISVPKSFESCDGFFVVFCSPYFTAWPWQESLWRTTDIGNWALIQLSLKRISSKTGRLSWFQANIICEYLWALYPSHLTFSSHIFSDLAQDLGKDWSEELEASSRE